MSDQADAAVGNDNTGNARFHAYPSIVSFRDATKEIQQRARFAGKDDNGKAIYDMSLPVPAYAMRGTVKLHGCNNGIGMSSLEPGNLWSQSRNLILTAEKRDSFGFYQFVVDRQPLFASLCQQVLDLAVSDGAAEPLKNAMVRRAYIFGEFAGKGIQRGVAISELERSFFIFAACVVDGADEQASWLSESAICNLKAVPDQRVYNIYDYQTFTIDIDFAHPEKSQIELERITEQVEKCCPVAAAFGKNGIGEGVVWSFLLKNQKQKVVNFKVKGDEHSVVASKKGAASVDPIKLAGVQAFVDYAVTENRLQQGIQQLFTAVGKRAEMCDTPHFVQWVVNDVFKEESARMTENGLQPNDVKKAIGKAARDFYTAFASKPEQQ
jgi:hypothetical protein